MVQNIASGKWKWALLVAAFIVAGATGAEAQQVSFKARPLGGDMVFNYTWVDAQARQQALGFRLPIEDLRRGEAEFQPFDNALAADFTFAKVKEYAEAHNGPQGGFKVMRTFEGYHVEAEGYGTSGNELMDQQMQNLQLVRDKAMDDYMAQMFYTRVDATHVMPDHKLIAKRYAPALVPVALAVQRQVRGDVRQTINFLLGFLQTIPYDTLLSRYTGNGAGFQTPYGLLLDNRGDCDTKSVALAAILRAMYPGLRLTMVYVPDHAFIGVALPRTADDYALKLGGGVFVLADPTGPRLMTLGQVNDQALSDLAAGRYSYQEIPF